jgi:hypothetical protein
VPDSSDIDAALIAKLQADTGAGGLATLAPDGWWMDEAPAGATQFGIVSLVAALDAPHFEGRASEDAIYLVKHVELSTVAVKRGKLAAARIDALLELGALTITGYHLLVMRRVERVRMTEVDDADSSIRWYHRGGRYQLMAAPIGT